MIHLLDVLVFREVVRTGSLTAAGNVLGLPKSSVARQLARLEEEVGCVLIARTTRTCTLTDAGRAFEPHAHRLLDDVAEAELALRAERGGASGLLNVSAPVTFGRLFIAPLIAPFRSRHPKVRINLHLTPQRVAVGVGETDVAIRLGPIVEKDVGRRGLGQIEFGLFATPGYIAAAPAINTPFDLARQQIIELRPPAGKYSMDLQSAKSKQIVRYIPTIEVNDPEIARQLALSGEGVAPLPLFLARQDLEEGRLAHVLPNWAPAPASISVLFAGEAFPSVRVNAFLDYLSATIALEKPWS